MSLREFCVICAIVLFATLTANEASAQVNCISYDATYSVAPCTNSTSLTGGNWTSSGATIDVAGYYNSGDGGGGSFYNGGTSCTPNTGIVFKDQGGTGTCWIRSKPTGNLRQWGITPHSQFDVSFTGASAASARTEIQDAYIFLAPLLADGTELTTDQVSIYLDETVQVPLTSGLSCGATGAFFNSVKFTGHPGTIYLAPGAYLWFPSGSSSVPSDSGNLHNCLILPQWLLDPSKAHNCSISGQGGTGGVVNGLGFSYPPTSYDDLEAIRANMIICGDRAVVSDGVTGFSAHDVWALGFDNPFYFNKADHASVNNTAADGDICYYSISGGGNTRVSNSDCSVFLTQDYPTGTGSHANNCEQTDPSGNLICNSEYYQISDIEPASSSSLNSYGRHNCQVTLIQGGSGGAKWGSNGPDPYNIPGLGYVRTLPPASRSSSATGDPINYPMWISNLTPSTGAISCLGHGPFAVQLISKSPPTPGHPGTAKLELLESEFGHGTNSGIDDRISATATWDACNREPCAIRIASGDVDAMETGEKVIFPNSTTANIVSVIQYSKGLDPYDGYISEIFVDVALPTAQTSTDATLYIDSMPQGTAYASSGLCNDASAGQCAFFHTGTRTFASTAPTASASLASSMLPESNTHPWAAGYLDNGTAGLNLVNSFSFSHHYGYAVQDANSTLMTNRAGDDNGELDDLSDTFYVVNGTSNQPTVQGGKGGQSGTGIVNNFYQVALPNSPSRTITSTSTVPSNGVGFSLSGDVTSFPSDLGNGHLNGKGTAAICPTPMPMPSGPCDLSKAPELVTYEITATGVTTGAITITSRGDYFTLPISTTMGSTVNITPATISRPDICSSLSSTVAPVTNPGQNSFENIGGCLQLVNVTGAQGKNAFIGGNAEYTDITNSNFTGLTFLYENNAALATMSGCGNNLSAAQIWNCTPPLSNGQVYFSLADSTTVQLCPFDGSGLIINNELVSIPSGCLLMKNTSGTGSNVNNYIYAVNDQQAVSNVVSDGGAIEVTTNSSPFLTGDQIFATCSGINGVLQANMSGLAIMKSSNSFDFNGGTFTGSYAYGGSCTLLGIQAQTTGHSTAPNGVETESSDPTKTLVGMIYLGNSQALSDSLTNRDVASWFNRHNRQCIATLSSTKSGLTTTGGAYAPVDASLLCEFVKLGSPYITWSTSGSALDATTGSIVSTSAGFDTASTNETEYTEGSSPARLSVAVAGGKGPTTEGRHTITMLYKVSSGSATYEAGSSVEIRLAQ